MIKEACGNKLQMTDGMGTILTNFSCSRAKKHKGDHKSYGCTTNDVRVLDHAKLWEVSWKDTKNIKL